MKKLALPPLVALLLTVAAPLRAGELAGVTMDEEITIDEQSLVLNGMALRKKAIFKVYVAGLYLPEPESSWQQALAGDGPRHMIMHWVRTVGKDSICDGWYDSLEANVADPSPELRRDFDTLCDAMEEAKTGDRYVFTYLPDQGTIVKVKGERKTVIEGKEFADALFSSWIGEHPGPGEDFRADLMGG